MKSPSSSLIREGFYLFLDLIVVSFGGWAFWLLISKLAIPSDIGYAITVISLVGIVGGLFGLGLDYSLLREVSAGNKSAFGTILLFELIILGACSPLLYMIGLSIYGSNFSLYMSLGVILMLLSGLGFVTRTSTISLLNNKKIFIYDALGTSIRFVLGALLVILGAGGVGILLANATQAALTGLVLLLFCYSKLGFSYSFKELIYLLRLGLSNFPFRLANILVGGLSIVLLALITSEPVTVGVFYIALAVSGVAGGFSISLATIVLPLSTSTKSDQSFTSIKMGLSLSAPLVAGLLSTPSLILSLIGQSYIIASESLRLLSLTIIPSIIVSNVISRLNHLKRMKEIMILGSIQLITFLIPFLILVPKYDQYGAAQALLISYIITGIISFKWTPPNSLKPVVITSSSILLGYLSSLPFIYLSEILAFSVSLIFSSLLLIVSKQITPKEMVSLLKLVFKKDKV